MLSAGDSVADLSGVGCEEFQRGQHLGALRHLDTASVSGSCTTQCGGVVPAFARHILASASIRRYVSVTSDFRNYISASAGVWCTLQFRFVQLQYPSLALAFEQLVLAVSMPLGAAIQTWGVVAAVGASPAAFYLAALLAAMYFTLAVPLQSSFHKEDTSGAAVGAVLPMSPPWLSPTHPPSPRSLPACSWPPRFARSQYCAYTKQVQFPII